MEDAKRRPGRVVTSSSPAGTLRPDRILGLGPKRGAGCCRQAASLLSRSGPPSPGPVDAPDRQNLRGTERTCELRAVA